MKFIARMAIVVSVVISFAVGLVGPAGALGPGAPASSAVTGAALTRFPGFAALADSRWLTDPVMLQGTLTDVAGRPMNGAQVLLAAWPSAEAVSRLPVGGSFEVLPVARTIASQEGSFQLRSLVTPLLSSVIGADGVDVEFNVFMATGTTSI